MKTLLNIFLSLCLLVHATELLSATNTKPKKESCLVFNNPDVGLGAIFFGLAKALDRFESGTYEGFKVDFNTGCYVDPDLGPNWWEYFFEPIALGNLKAKELRYNSQQSLLLVPAGYNLSRNRIGELFQKYVYLKPELQQEIDDLVESNFRGYYVIGVHHRGTDKRSEAVIIPFSDTLQALEELIAILPQNSVDHLRIFVATDEQAFLDKLSALYPDQVICNDFIRSTNKMPLHYSKDKYGTNYQKGKEAIVDCYMLSKCNYLIFPATSSFSFFSTRWNPKIPNRALIPKNRGRVVNEGASE